MQVFSATFKGQETTQGNATTSTPPIVQVESVAPTSNLEVLAVNLSALNSAGSIEAFSGDFGSPAEQEQARLAAFCRELLSENPGPRWCLTACTIMPCNLAAESSFWGHSRLRHQMLLCVITIHIVCCLPFATEVGGCTAVVPCRPEDLRAGQASQAGCRISNAE